MFLFRSKESRSRSPPRQRDKEAPPLHDYIQDADIRELRRLAEKHGTTSISQMICATDSVGRNAIHVSCETGNVDVLVTVVKSLAPALVNSAINARDASGATPLFISMRCGSKKCVRELLKLGTDISTRDNHANTLYHAPFDAPFLHKGHVDALKELVTFKQLDINALNGKGITALQVACSKDAYDCAKVLLANGADPTINKCDPPTLFSAVVANNSALVQALLEAGADVGQTNAQGQALMEVINPKCEIYRIIKRFLINRPGGIRKLNLEACLIGTRVSDLSPEVLKIVERSGLTTEEIESNWSEFCKVIRLVAKKRIVASAEEAALIEEKKGQRDDKELAKEVDDQALLPQLASTLLIPGEPKKIFKKMRIAGSGGFGMVFQGRGPDKRQWAIKRMANNSASEKLANLREASFLKQCNHRNICAYKATYDCPSEHELWLIMELLRGGTLDESIGNLSDSTGDFFEERHLAYTATEIMRGLDYLHGRNIVHRDLKSQNIMFTLEGDVKIIDFGAAISIADTTKIHKEVIGSPYWMAPEMILRKPYSWQVDIWSSAVCIIELANRRPPDNTSVLRHLFHIATGKRTWLDKPDSWTEHMKNFLDQCTQYDPKQRPRAAVLARHKWCSAVACTQPEMSRLLQQIFAARAYDDV